MRKVLVLLFVAFTVLFAVGCTSKLTVTFDTNGGSAMDPLVISGTSVIGKPADPVKEGHTFIGWYDEKLEQPFDFEKTVIEHSLTLYAKWETNEYTVTFKDHEGNDLMVITKRYGDPIDASSVQIEDRLGYTFARWSPEIPTTVPAENLVFTPVYQPVTFEVLLFSLNDALIDTLEVGYQTTITLPQPTHPKYTFIGWSHVNGIILDSFTQTTLFNTSLFSTWEGFDQGFRYRIFLDWITIESYEGTEKDVIIPESIDGYPVKFIHHEAFKDNTVIESIDLGKSVIAVGDQAFAGMTSLKHVIMHDQTFVFGNAVFYRSSKIESMVISSRTPKSIAELFGGILFDIPATLEFVKFAEGGVGYSSYMMATWPDIQTTVELAEPLISIQSMNLMESKVNHLIIPSSVTEIGDYAFAGMFYLQSVTFHDDSKLESIGIRSFMQTAIQTMVIPKHVESIGSEAFMNMPLLQAFEVDPDNVHFTSVDGVLYSKDLTWLYRYPTDKDGETYQIPETVTDLENAAFYGAYRIRNLIFGSHSSLKHIGDYAFYHMFNLESLELPDGVVSLGSFIVSDAMKISHLYVPSSVETIKLRTFPSHMLVKTVILMEATDSKPGFEEGWDSIPFTVVFDYKEMATVDGIVYALRNNGTAVLLDGEAYRGQTQIVIPETVLSHVINEIGAFAFSLLGEVESIQLPVTIGKIGSQAFAHCHQLTTINLRELINLKVIRERAFYETKLTRVVLPSQLEFIGYAAFSKIITLEMIFIPESVTVVQQGIVDHSVHVIIRIQRTSIPATWHPLWNPYQYPTILGSSIPE